MLGYLCRARTRLAKRSSSECTDEQAEERGLICFFCTRFELIREEETEENRRQELKSCF